MMPKQQKQNKLTNQKKKKILTDYLFCISWHLKSKYSPTSNVFCQIRDADIRSGDTSWLIVCVTLHYFVNN